MGASFTYIGLTLIGGAESFLPYGNPFPAASPFGSPALGWQFFISEVWMSWIDEVDARLPLVTPSLLKTAMPQCPSPELWAAELSKAMAWGGIATRHDVAMFLAQVGHESNDLTDLEESLWYSADRLREVWPSRFRSDEEASKVAGNPEALALAVYSGRMGNGPARTGDGWRFIGRGPIMLTGRYLYDLCGKATGLPLTQQPGLLASSPHHGAMAAVWYWNRRVTPGASLLLATRQINGGTIGLNDRQSRYDRMQSWVMAEEVT